MRTQFAIWAGKIAGKISKMIGFGGSTIPGVIARIVDGAFLRHLRRNAKTIIYITGTNGKTTTTNLIAKILETSGKTVIANREGANMVTGISATIVRNAPLLGVSLHDVAVIEVDEASLPRALSECQPDYLIVTNFFRDQLDRYGEIDMLIQKMITSLQSTKVKLILNADDPFVHRFAALPIEKLYIGMSENACQFPSYKMGESKFCPNCMNELSYRYVHFGQLGHYECSCGFSRPHPDFSAEKVYQNDKGIHLLCDREYYQTTLKGLYNAYNVLFAISICKTLGVESNVIRTGLLTYQLLAGRMQEFIIDHVSWKLNLVKNPAGGNLTLAEFMRTKEEKQLIFCLNDLLADGEDISWIWDIDMEMANQEEVKFFIASGKRAHDAALRMKYSGIPTEKIVIIPDLKEAVLEARRNGLPTNIMATYTCLSPIGALLRGETGKEKVYRRFHFWGLTLRNRG